MMRQTATTYGKQLARGWLRKVLLPYLLVAGLFGGAGLFVFFLANSTLDQVFPGEEGEAVHLSEAVLEHKPVVIRYAKEYGVGQHVGLLLALMMHCYPSFS